jgi:large subunit ribosomal protein L24e
VRGSHGVNAGRTHFFVSSKAESLFNQKKNPRKIAWTVLYRRKHKKGIAEEATKKRTRRIQKFERAIAVSCWMMVLGRVSPLCGEQRLALFSL